MVSGLPLVATRVSGTEEVVWDGFSGWLFDPRCPEEGAEHIRQLMNDPALWRSQSKVAVQAAERFDVTTVGRMLEGFYEDVLVNGTSAPSQAVAPLG
jgi:glycosyltransferase involved in cell wall biosynthesis